jgi:hypothetical protein
VGKYAKIEVHQPDNFFQDKLSRPGFDFTPDARKLRVSHIKTALHIKTSSGRSSRSGREPRNVSPMRAPEGLGCGLWDAV